MDIDFSLKHFTQPNNWQDFENMCKELLDLEYPHQYIKTKKNTTLPQNGVDSYKQLPNCCIGVQSKKKDLDVGKAVTIKDIKEEIRKAKKFSPKLNKYIIITSLPIDSKTETFSRRVNQRYLNGNFFEIEIWCQKKIKELLNKHIEVYKKYFPVKEHGFSPTFVFKELFKEIENPTDYIEKSKKIESEKWDSMDNSEKYIFLNKKASAFSKIGQEQEAANELIKALEYDSTAENSLTNATSAYYVLKDAENMLAYSKKVFAINPKNENVWNILLAYRLSKKEDISIILQDIPNEIKEKGILLNVNIASHYRYIKAFNLALRHLDLAKKALATEINSPYKVNVYITEIDIISENPKNFNMLSFTKEEKERVSNAVKELINIWSKITDPNEAKASINCCLSISQGYYILKNEKESEKYLMKASDCNENHLSVITRTAFKLYENDKVGELIEYVESKDPKSLDENLRLMLSQAYVLNNQDNKGIELLKGIIKTTVNPEHKIKTMLILKDTLYKNNRYKEFAEILDNISNDKEFTIPYNVLMHDFKHHGKKEIQDFSYLYVAKKAANKDTSIYFLAFLGRAFYENKKYEDGVEVFELFINKDLYNQITQYYLDCLLRVKPIEALQIAEKIPADEKDLFIFRLISNIYLKTGEYRKVIELLKDSYSALDTALKLVFLRLSLREDSHEGLFEKAKELEKLPLTNEEIEDLAKIYQMLEKETEALELLYKRIIIDRKSSPTLETLYFYLAILENKNPKTPDKVEVGSVVVLNHNNIKTEYIIEDNVSPILFFSLNPKTPLAKELLGKKKGDIVTYRSNIYSDKQEYVLTDIYDKHIYFGNKISSTIEQRYPNSRTINSFNVNPDKIEDFFKIVKKVTEDSVKAKEFIMPHQQKGLFSVESYSILTKEDIFDSYLRITNSPDMIYFSSYDESDIRKELSLLIGMENVVVELISLFTIFKLNLLEAFKMFFNKIRITQHSFQELLIKLDKLAHDKSTSNLAYDAKTDKPILVETGEFKKKELEELTAFKQWIEKNCEVIPAKAVLNYSEKEYEMKKQLFGTNTAETLLEAINRNEVLYCDDFIVRKLGNNDKPFKTFSILTFLYMAKEKEIISFENAIESLIKLIILNYRNIPITNREILYAFSKKDNSFERLCQKIPPGMPSDNLIRVIYDLLVFINKNYSFLGSSNYLIDTVLQNYDKKERQSLIAKLKKLLEKRDRRTVLQEKIFYYIKAYK